jgi:hypothetical protein
MEARKSRGFDGGARTQRNPSVQLDATTNLDYRRRLNDINGAANAGIDVVYDQAEFCCPSLARRCSRREYASRYNAVVLQVVRDRRSLRTRATDHETAI